jgi:hypothetical protein
MKQRLTNLRNDDCGCAENPDLSARQRMIDDEDHMDESVTDGESDLGNNFFAFRMREVKNPGDVESDNDSELSVSEKFTLKLHP